MRFDRAAAFAALLLLAACNQQPATGPGAGPGPSAGPSAGPNSGGGGSGLQGADRDSFVSAAVGTCTTKQQNDPSNRGISQATITQFCTCYANQMADKISPSELVSLNTQLQADPSAAQAALQPRATEATNTCVAQIRGNGGVPAGNGGNGSGGNPAPANDNTNRSGNNDKSQ